MGESMKDFDGKGEIVIPRLWLALFSLFAWLELRLFERNFEHGAWLLEELYLLSVLWCCIRSYCVGAIIKIKYFKLLSNWRTLLWTRINVY